MGLYHEGNTWFTISLKERIIQFKGNLTGQSQPRRMLEYVKKDANCRSQPAILNKLDEYVQDKESINYLQCGSYSGYTTLLVSSLIPKDSEITVYEKDTERRAVSTDMITNLANKSGINFVDEITAPKPFDLIFITSDKEDDCFKVLQTIESKKLTKPGTVLIIDRILTRQSVQMLIYVRTGEKTFKSKMLPVKEAFSHVQDALEYVEYL